MHSVRSLPVLLRVVAAGGSHPPPCISSCLLRTRVVAVQPPPALRLSYGVYHASFFTCSFPSAQPVRLLRRSPWQALPTATRGRIIIIIIITFLFFPWQALPTATRACEAQV